MEPEWDSTIARLDSTIEPFLAISIPVEKVQMIQIESNAADQILQ